MRYAACDMRNATCDMQYAICESHQRRNVNSRNQTQPKEDIVKVRVRKESSGFKFGFWQPGAHMHYAILRHAICEMRSHEDLDATA